MPTYTTQKAGTAHNLVIQELLLQNKLPVEDLETGKQTFWIVEDGENIAGAIALEPYGAYGLLRSMATHENYRNQGIAALLVQALLTEARHSGIKEIYLLTETAETYFSKKGFKKIHRDDVPEDIKQSKEFSHICPSSAIVMKKETQKKKLLFVCVENSNRSQMSQAFASILGGDAIEAYSAGSKPSGIVNPKAIAAMKELGYDLSKHDSKSLDEVKAYAPFDAVVTMGCGDACPWMPAKQFIDWQIPDPKHMEPEDFNKVRDYIREKVGELLKLV
jgi:N-acetylglutamate synthase-like GNAT family acetyltransferase